jgi:hypothetical protein
VQGQRWPWQEDGSPRNARVSGSFAWRLRLCRQPTPEPDCSPQRRHRDEERRHRRHVDRNRRRRPAGHRGAQRNSAGSPMTLASNPPRTHREEVPATCAGSSCQPHVDCRNATRWPTRSPRRDTQTTPRWCLPDDVPRVRRSRRRFGTNCHSQHPPPRTQVLAQTGFGPRFCTRSAAGGGLPRPGRSCTVKDELRSLPLLAGTNPERHITIKFMEPLCRARPCQTCATQPAADQRDAAKSPFLPPDRGPCSWLAKPALGRASSSSVFQ